MMQAGLRQHRAIPPFNLIDFKSRPALPLASDRAKTSLKPPAALIRKPKLH